MSLVPVYDDLVKAWADESAFGEAIRKACDYHCDKTFDDDKGLAEFIWSPYGVLPVELLAVRRVRAMLGQGFPHIAHPLLETPFFFPPEITALNLDDLMQRVRQTQGVAVRAEPGVLLRGWEGATRATRIRENGITFILTNAGH